MSIPLYQVDAFTSTPFGGNPAAVCLLPAEKEDQWLQAVAQEMNLSETAFLLKQDDGYNLRWFTPVTEVNLCGHATLASAHILYETGALSRDQQARFFTRSGLLTADYDGGIVILDFPTRPPVPTELPAGLAEALGVEPLAVVQHGNRYLLELASEEAVKKVQPDFTALRRIPVRAVIITAPAVTHSPFDFISRYFGPGIGIDEDPVTGSAHCILVPYWASKLGKKEFLAYQASRRGGVLDLELAGDRVRIGGQAATVFKAELLA